MDKNIGKKLDGRYEITELIGVGGMADVYKGTDIIDNKPVAIKILKKEFSENEEFLRRFRNESKAIAVLSHPNIVRIYDVGFSEKIQYIIMEYIDGITLKEYIEEEKILSWKDTVHFVIQILRALQHAHDRGVVHRDIKPQNIMMFTDGTIKVMDFGIAKFAREEGKTATDQAIGSVHYISPEQAKGDVTDERSDIYSVGVMLYEMLTGKKPFDSDNPVSIAVMHMHDIPERPKAVNANIPDGLEEIILRAMEKDPDERYQTTSEMIDDIEEFKNNPDVSFGYYTEEEEDEAESTKFFDTVNSGNMAGGVIKSSESMQYNSNINNNNNDDDYYVADNNSGYNDGYYIDDDDDDDEEEEKRSSLLVPVLTAVTIVVIVVAVVFLYSVIKGTLFGNNSSSNSVKMPSLIGMDYNEALKKYGKSIKIVNEGTEYNEMQKDCIFYQSIEPKTPVNKATEVKVKVSLGMQTVTVPDLKDRNFVLAERSLTDVGLVAEKRNESSDEFDKDQVIRTEPEAGTAVEPGTKVILYVSMGKNSAQFKMDNFVGKTIEQASELCSYRELVLKTVEEPSYEKEGIVFEQSIEPGTETEAGTEITLHVSDGTIPEGSVNYSVTLPEDASGRFELDFIIDGKPSDKSSGTIIAPQLRSISVDIPGQGEAANVTVTITNRNNYKTVTLGTYVFDFSKQSYRATSEDIHGALSQIDGLYVAPTEPPHQHEWLAADCYNPKKCKTCGETEGNALGHDFGNNNPNCSRCGTPNPNYNQGGQGQTTGQDPNANQNPGSDQPWNQNQPWNNNQNQNWGW